MQINLDTYVNSFAGTAVDLCFPIPVLSNGFAKPTLIAGRNAIFWD